MGQAQQLEQGLVEMAIEVPAAAQEKLLAYAALLYKWNRTYSLTAMREQDKAVSHHFLDSLAVLPFVTEGRLLDVGSGGGMPGIPLAIVRPGQHVTLLDLPGSPVESQAAEALTVLLDERLTAAHIAVEADLLRRRPSFERPYGWAWGLQLAAAAHTSPRACARGWAEALTPMREGPSR